MFMLMSDISCAQLRKRTL